MTPSRILVGLDGSPNAATALRWGLAHAAATSAEVDAVHAFFVPVLAYSAPGLVPPEQLDAERRAGAVLGDTLAHLPVPDATRVSLRVVEGRPTDVIAEAADDPDVALVVVGARGHNIEDLVLGSVTHSLTHRCHKPLVVVPARWEGGDGRVVVGVSGSPGSLGALRWAVSYARGREAAVEAVTVFEPGGETAARRRAEGLLADALEQVDTTGLVVASTVVEGRPAELLLERAEGADILVVGTRGIGALQEALTGSVTHSCAAHGQVPVAVIRG